MKHLASPSYQFLCFLVIVLAFRGAGFAADQPKKGNTVDLVKLQTLNDQEMIKTAIETLKKNGSSVDWQTFDPKQYDRINVLRDKKSVSVSFSRQITYVPYQTALAHGVSIDLGPQEAISCHVISNPETFPEGKTIFFFQPSEIHKKATEEIKGIIRSQFPDLYADHKRLAQDASVVIQEESTYYEVEIKTSSVLTRLAIDKSSGKVLKSKSKQYQK